MADYLHYDVFTDRPFQGNQLAVFAEASGLSVEQMQTITQEMNFSECTFLLPVDAPGSDFHMRIFTPDAELPMAGHPTIGTTFALAELGRIPPGTPRVVFQLAIGPTPVELSWRERSLAFAWMDQQPPQFRPSVSSAETILRAIGLDDAARPPERWPIEDVSCGVPFTLVPLASRVQVDRAEPDTVALRRLESAFETGHPAVFLFSLEPQGGDATVYSRMFAPSMGLIEDPATGGASGPLGCYLAAHQLVPPSQWLEMTSMQGVRMRRPSRVHIRVHGERPDAITRVQVGGQAVKIGRGTIDAAW